MGHCVLLLLLQDFQSLQTAWSSPPFRHLHWSCLLLLHLRGGLHSCCGYVLLQLQGLRHSCHQSSQSHHAAFVQPLHLAGVAGRGQGRPRQHTV